MGDIAKLRTGPQPEFKLPNTVKDLLKRIRKGTVHSVAIVAVQTDGTFWSGAASSKPGGLDVVQLIGAMRFLEEDLVRKAHGEPTRLTTEES